MVHAVVGGLLAQISGGDFRTGALAAGANEAVVADLNKLVEGDPNLLSMSSQLVGLLAASTQSNASGDSLKTGVWVAQNGTQYNFGDHLPPGLSEYGQAATSLMEYMQNRGASSNEMDQAARALSQGQGFEGVQPATEFVKAWSEFMAGELSGLGLAAIVGKAGSWFAKATGEAVDGATIGAKGVDAAATDGTKAAATEGTFPDEVLAGKRPHQTTPGTGIVTQERYNPATGKLENSVIEYDQYGRQVKRTDYTNHGYGN